MDELETHAENDRLRRRLSGVDMVPLQFDVRPVTDPAVSFVLRRIRASSYEAVLGEPLGAHFFRLFAKYDLRANAGFYCVNFLEDAATFAAMEPGPNRARFLRQIVKHYFLSSQSPVPTPRGVRPDPADQASMGPRIELPPALLDALRREVGPDSRGGDGGDGVLEKAEAEARRQVSAVYLPLFLGSSQCDRYGQLRELCGRRRPGPMDFVHFRVVGIGAFGEVAAMSTKDSRKVYAVKKISMRQVKSQRAMELLANERHILAMVRSRFATRLHYAFCDHKDGDFNLVMDYASGGDVRYHLRNNEDKGPFPRDRALYYAAEMLLGLEHLHGLGVLYRDLKPSNALIHQSGHLMLSDFGLAVIMHANGAAGPTNRAGTAGYWAPEVMMEVVQGPPADVWSWGITLYRMVAGRRPQCTCRPDQWCTMDTHDRAGKDTRRREESVRRARNEGLLSYNTNLDWDPSLPADVRQLLEAVLDPLPELRPTLADLKRSRLFAGLDFALLAAGRLPPPFVPGVDEVYAESLAAVGERETFKYRNVELTREDRSFFEGLEYYDERAQQEEIAEALDLEFERLGPMPVVGYARGQAAGAANPDDDDAANDGAPVGGRPRRSSGERLRDRKCCTIS